jgi:hypothetical protein
MNLLATLSVSATPRRLSADLKLEHPEELGVDESADVPVFQPVGVVRAGRFGLECR